MRKKVTASCLAAAMLLGCLSGCSDAKISEDTAAGETAMETVTEVSEEGHSAESGKEETVYVFADAEGRLDSAIVSTWLKNAGGESALKDVSNLKDLAKVKGEGGFTQQADGTILWDADGKDVYYQGVAGGELPVELSVKYTLDGKEVSPRELEGASGHLVIRIDYKNNAAHVTRLNGEAWTVYQPYVMISTLMLDHEKAENITVENGEIVDGGNTSIVVGVGMPGLTESLGLDRLIDQDGNYIDDVELPDHVVVEADVKDFSLLTILTVASDDALKKLNLDDIDSVDKLRDSMDELADGMVELRDGVQELYDAVWGDLSDGINDLKDGTQELYDGVWGDLTDGVEDLKDGTKKLDNGAKDLNDGAKQLAKGAEDLDSGAKQLVTGAGTLKAGIQSAKSGASDLDGGMASLCAGLDTLSQGAETLNGNSAALLAGGTSVVDTLFASATKSLQESLAPLGYTVEELNHSNYKQVLDQLTQGVSGAALSTVTDGVQAVVEEQVTAAVEAQKNEIKSQVTAKVRENVQAQVEGELESQIRGSWDTETNGELTDEILEALLNEKMASAEAAGLIDAKMDSEEISAVIEEQTEATVQKLIEENVAAKMGSDEVSEIIREKLNELNPQLEQLNAAVASLYQVGAFYDGLKEYTDGVGQLAQAASANGPIISGAKTLKNGTASLKSGLGELENGADTLCGGLNTLKNGTGDLSDGADELYDGTKKLLDGTGELKKGVWGDLADGLDDLRDGTKKLNDAVQGELSDGIDDLKDGVGELNDGVIKLDEEGIQKIINMSEQDIENVYDRLMLVKDWQEQEASFGGCLPGMPCSTKYIFKTESIGE